MNKLIKEVSLAQVNSEFLKCLNGLMNLTSREMEVLAGMMTISEMMEKKERAKASMDATQIRKDLIGMTGVTRENLSRYIKSFKQKGIIVQKGKGFSVNEAIIPIIIGGKTVQITLILKIKNDNI